MPTRDNGPSATHPQHPAARRGFTLIELLVVIAIIALLVGILLPALGRARDSAKGVQCSTNLKNITTALLLYSNDYKGKFPPNMNGVLNEAGTQGIYWYDVQRLGQYLPQTNRNDGSGSINETIGGGVMACPNHPSGGRSYTQNYYATSVIDGGRAPNNAVGRGFDVNSVIYSSKTLLVGEAWGTAIGGDANFGTSWYTVSTMGWNATNPRPGQRFGGGSGITLDNITQIPPDIQLDSFPKSFIPYYRHPRRLSSTGALRGSAYLGFVDGHVDAWKPDELIEAGPQGFSTYKVLWSNIDQQVERPNP